MGHPGTPNLYDTGKPVADGGLCFRARFGTKRKEVNLLAEGSYPAGSEIKNGYPEFIADLLKKLGWWKDLTDAEKQAAEGGGDETRSNPWLAKLQQDMFAEVNPRDANNAGIRDGVDTWLETPEGARIKVKALITRRVAPGVVFAPFH